MQSVAMPKPFHCPMQGSHSKKPADNPVGKATNRRTHCCADASRLCVRLRPCPAGSGDAGEWRSRQHIAQQLAAMAALLPSHQVRVMAAVGMHAFGARCLHRQRLSGPMLYQHTVQMPHHLHVPHTAALQGPPAKIWCMECSQSTHTSTHTSPLSADPSPLHCCFLCW
jgi:hypothetical protein